MVNLIYKNHSAIRNRTITEYLFKEISEAIEVVYGPDVFGVIYSGGQTPKRRTGSVRHDGGKAADVHLYKGDKVLKGIELGLLAQYWAAKKIGGVGLEMRGGGIHLDQWSTPPKGGGMFWFYDNPTQDSIERRSQRSMVSSGINGNLPVLYSKPSFWDRFNKFRSRYKVKEYRNGK